MIGHEGRYLDTRRAVLPLVERTTMALAACSLAAATAAMATLSAVGVGRGVSALSSSNRTGYEIADSARMQVSAIILTVMAVSRSVDRFLSRNILTGLDRVGTLGSLAGQHDAVGTVENSVGDIADFGTRRARVDGHGLPPPSAIYNLKPAKQAHLKHLGRADDGLASDITLGNHHLLGDEYLAGWNLNTEITTSNHDTVRLLQDLVKVLNTLLIFNLDDDLDGCAIRAKDSTDVTDILGRADEGSKDHVDTVLDTELEVSLVLLAQRRQVDGGLGKVDTLAGR